MKKFLTLLCMLTCILGLTACGSEETLTEYQKQKVAAAEERAKAIVPMLEGYIDADLDEFTMEEIQYRVGSIEGINVEGYAFYSAVESFRSAADSVGRIRTTGSVTSRIDDDQIIVEVEVLGEKKDAVAEVIFSNDMFLTLESAALNPVSTMGELMTGAALNTLIGMGTVFVVLILISAIISCFNVIPKLQSAAAARKAKETEQSQSAAVDTAQPAVAATVDESDDLELAAVIAAAIAAYEGAASTDGFVVRSIRRYR